MASQKQVTGWVGWVYYAGFMMALVGILQVIAGLIALFNNKVIVSGPQAVWLFDITTWGWVHLIVGAVVAWAGFAVLSGKVWARTVGVLLAGISAIVNFAYIPVYPFWALLFIVIDMLVVYALIAHGDELRTA